MRGVLVISAVATAMAFALPRAQQRADCELDVRTKPGSSSRIVMLGENDSRLDAGGGVEAFCGNRSVRADSATYFQGRGELYLYGNVFYEDESRTLEADSAVYYENEARVRADGHVVLTDVTGGSTLTGPVLHYYPQTEGRPVERIFAPGRPHLTFQAEGSGANEAQPFEVDAERIHIYSDSVVAAAGEVVAIRGELTALGDSMDLDLGRDELWLLGGPSMQVSDMTLEGDTIRVLLDESRVREILAWPNGSAVGSDMSMAAPLLRFYVEDGDIGRAVASPMDRADAATIDRPADMPWARAESQDYVLLADSIEIRRPGGQLDRLTAVGRARATSTQPAVPGDSAIGNDWIVGDTITGYFVPAEGAYADTAAAADSVPGPSGQRQAQLERLVATGSARALYHLIDDRGVDSSRPGVNYVMGRVVTLRLEAGEVREARVIGPSTGLYLEPLPIATDGDSLAVTPEDSVAAPPDTSGSAQRTSGR